MNWIEQITEIKKEDRPIPFWSWNDQLDRELLIQQIKEMKKQGIGGFFMHARAGLKTPYMGKEWMQCVKDCMDEAQKCEMDAWCYDEEGWPSGFAGGKVTENHPEYSLCWLTYDKERGKVNKNQTQYYVDLLNEKSVKEFLMLTHEKYLECFPDYFDGRLTGFFTDEPQYARNKIPWSPVIPITYEKMYHKPFHEDDLSKLFVRIEGSEKFRYEYYRLISNLFTESFMKQVGNWCKAHGTNLTGHVMLEESLYDQMSATAGVMPSYEYMDIPGIDWLTRSVGSPVTPKQVSSVAEQLGKKRVLSETFALCGWGVTFEELKWIAQWQFVNGINMLCPHLQGYTLRGCRKRDYPPGLFLQQPWWEKYKELNDYFSRVGMLLREGKHLTDLLFLHPMESAYMDYDGSRGSLKDRNVQFEELATILNEEKVLWHFGDEGIIAKYGRITKGKFQVGNAEYETVLLPKLKIIRRTTCELLREFLQRGGTVIAPYGLPEFIEGNTSVAEDDIKERIGDLENNKIETNLSSGLEKIKKIIVNGEGPLEELHYTQKQYGKEMLFYFTNLNKENIIHAKIILKGIHEISLLSLEKMSYEAIDTEDMVEGICIHKVFQPMEACFFVTGAEVSRGLITNDVECSMPSEEEQRDYDSYKINKKWKIEEKDPNILTLDYCTYRLDDGEWQPKIAVIQLSDKLIKSRYHGKLEMKYCFESEINIPKIELILEEPERFKIYLNGLTIDNKDNGYWMDTSFRIITLNNVMKGINVLSISCIYYQREEVFHVLLDPDIHESEKNKLTMDTELESIYLAGDFGVYNKKDFTYGVRKSIFTGEEFVLRESPKEVMQGSLIEQGFPFFSGRLRLSLETEELPEFIQFSYMEAPIAECFVNGYSVGNLLWAPYKVDVRKARRNKNIVSVVLYSSLRNTLGPHHHIEGECYHVSPGSFSSTLDWDENGTLTSVWRDDSYCLIPFGIGF